MSLMGIAVCPSCSVAYDPHKMPHYCRPPSPVGGLTDQRYQAALRERDAHADSLQTQWAVERQHVAHQANMIAQLSQALSLSDRENVLLTEELLRLKAKYEPDPPPAPNPWGRMFKGGVGAAIER